MADCGRPIEATQRRRMSMYRQIVRRQLFRQSRTHQALVRRGTPARRPLVPTPHIPDAPSFFRALNNEPGGGGNDAGQFEGVAHVEVVEEAATVMVQPNARKQRRKRRRRVADDGILAHPNLKSSVRLCKDFVNKAEMDAREILSHRICAAKQSYALNRIVVRGQDLACQLLRITKGQGWGQAESRLFQKLEIANWKVEEILEKFQDKIEKKRQELKSARGVDSRKRVCCYYCLKKEK